MTINSERPGVYTSYNATNISYSRTGRGVVGLVAIAETGTANKIKTINSAIDAKNEFGSCNLTRIVEILLQNGVYEVRAIPVFRYGNNNDPAYQTYGNAFTLLAAEEDVQVIVCDSALTTVHNAMKTAILGSDNKNQYKIGVVESSGSVSDIVSAAAALNCERMIMAAPGAIEPDGTTPDYPYLAPALAGAIVSSQDPALPLNGAQLYGLGGVSTALTESQINALVTGGVCPVECVGGVVSVIRGVTTYTTDTHGDSDPTWHELTTIRIVDDIIPEVKSSLKTMFARAKNTAQTRDAIRTQVVVILERKVASEIIDGYGSVVVTQDESDPTVCNVSFDFAVVHGINKIILTANITV